MTTPIPKPATGSTGWDVSVDAVIDRVNELADVDPTSDADKPVSTAQQAALDLKLNAADAPELVRDTVATTLVAGTNVTITPDDVADTITIAASGGGGSGGPVYARTTSDTPVTSTSDSDVTGLSWPLDSGVVYALELTIFYTAGTTGDMAISLSTPSVSEAIMGRMGAASATPTNLTALAFANMALPQVLGGEGTGARKIALYRAVFTTSASGTAQVRVRQNTSDAANATTVLIGSYGALIQLS